MVLSQCCSPCSWRLKRQPWSRFSTCTAWWCKGEAVWSGGEAQTLRFKACASRIAQHNVGHRRAKVRSMANDANPWKNNLASSNGWFSVNLGASISSSTLVMQDWSCFLNLPASVYSLQKSVALLYSAHSCTLLFEHEVKDATKGAEQSSIEANISKQHKSIQISRKIQNSFLLLPSTSGIWPPFSLCVAMALSPCLQRNAIAKAYTVVTTLSTTILI